MLKLMFIPFRLFSGVLAGVLSKKLFERIWGLIDKQQPPEPQQRRISVAKLATALALEGAVFRAVRGLADHGARETFERLTGRWPGKQRPQPE